METTTAAKMPGTPPRWVNRTLEAALRVPGLRSILGRSFALITVVGSRTGNRYTTPVQYVCDGDHYLVTSQRHRRWWRNIRANPTVEFVVRGEPWTLRARIAEPPESVDLLDRMLRADPRTARFYGITVDEGRPDPLGVADLSEHVVVLVIGDE